MASLTRSLKDLRSIADNKPETYSVEASKVFAPKIEGKENPLHARVIKQINEEYDEGWQFCRPKLKEGMSRLKLYNNQARDKTAVGDPLLFTTHQTVLAALYYDKLQVEAMPREEGDEDRANNYNALTEFDYDEMGKAEVDYEWDWDAGMFGRGLALLNEFDRESKTPIPEAWDPLTFIRDPHATSVNGNRLGKGALGYGHREVYMKRWEMEENPEYFNLGKMRRTGKDYNSATFLADQERKRAQGLQNEPDSPQGDNYEYCITQSFAILDGKKYLVETANNRKLVVRLTPLGDYWPLIDRSIYPMAHDWDGVSIADIVEDKQRFRAELINIYGASAKADLFPMYLMDASKISRERDLTFGYNKFIPVNGPVGENIIYPLRKFQPSAQGSYILDFLDTAIQKALATPDIRQGVPSKDQRTLGETQLMSAGVDTRYSLTARLWGLSEKRFWQQHYRIYERDFASGVSKKTLRLTGPLGPKFKDLKRTDFISDSPLGFDIKIESRELSEAKKQRDFNQLGIYFSSVLADPNADRLYSLRKWGKLIAAKDEVERILPLTIDERRARAENDDLSEDNAVPVSLEDNHVVHLRENSYAEDTPTKAAHLQAHEEALIMKRTAPQAFPMMPEDMAMMQGGPQKSMAAAAPAMANQQPQPPQMGPGAQNQGLIQ